MPLARRLLPLLFPLLVLTALLAAGPPQSADAARREQARVRKHLLGAERAMLARDVSRLSPSQRRARAHHLAVLREYRRAGVFPHNHELPGARVPVFVDRHGTHCAVGYLLARAGREDIVRRVSAARNLARVPELADDPVLVAWLDRAGISLAEAARIQPTYEDLPDVVIDDTDQRDRVSTGYAAA